MGSPLPGAVRGRVDLDRPAVGATTLQVSHLSPLDRKAVLPPHHPQRTTEHTPYPYPLWSAGVAPDSAPRPPEVVELRGERLAVVVDLRRGGRVVGVRTAGREWRASPRTVSTADDVRGAGLRHGLEINASPFPRSPWSLDPVHAAIGLPTRVGGDRLRWWELERVSGHLVQVDLHVPDGGVRLLVVVRQTPLVPTSLAPAVRLLVDDPGIPEPVAGRPGDVSWFVVAFEGEAAVAPGQLAAAIAGLDDPVLQSCGRLISHGPGWAALEIERLVASGRPVPFDLAATPVAALEHVEIANRLRAVPETQWLHLMRDEGLGVIDRVHPQDVGHPAGAAWADLLHRSRRRESLGDWRVHLREGELAFVSGDRAEAERRWDWSYSLRPTAWADRNLALIEAVRGRSDLAAVRYLRAQRTLPADVELGVEAVGALVGSGRAGDARQVLDRMALAGHASGARYWLLEGEVARARGRQPEVEEAIEAASRCADAAVHTAWAEALRDDVEREGPTCIA